MLNPMPNEIKVGWKTYEIQYSQAKLNSGGELYGQIDYDNCVIVLRESSTPDQLRATLIHEMLHAISEMYGLELEEKLVTDLANALYTVYKDNLEKEQIMMTDVDQTEGECSEDSRDQYMENQQEENLHIRIYDKKHPNQIEVINTDKAIIFSLHNAGVNVSSYAGWFLEEDLQYLVEEVKDKIFQLK